MKSLTGVVVCVAAVWTMSASVQAQTLTTRWDGFYAGLNAGAFVPNDGVQKASYENAIGGLNTGSRLGFFPLGSAPNSSFIGGVQAGYNRSVAWVVLGAETDFQWMNATTTVASSPIVVGQQSPMSIQRSQSWFGTTRVKLGFAPMPYLLLYGTGGLAYGNPSLSVGLSSNNVAPPVNSFATTSGTHVGWAVGLGAELAVADRWSIKAEWLHYDLGTNSVSNGYTFGNSSLTTTVSENGDIVRGGVNFKF